MAEDTLNAFTSLLDSIPGWITELESILKSSADRQKEALYENQPAEQHLVPRRKRSKTSSMGSRPSKGIKEDTEPPTSPPENTQPTLVKEQVPHMTPSDALRLAQRKRKTASVCSARESGPYKYRSRSMVIVYYDGDVQKRFDAIVRSIATSRNNLRRSRTNAKVNVLSRTISSGSDGSSDDIVRNLRSLRYRSSRDPTGTAAGEDGVKMEEFDKADGLLHKAQELCERAAHQILRDGDCALEIRNAKEHFENLQKLGETELPRLREKAEKDAERQRRIDERKKVEAEAEAEAETKLRKSPNDFSSNEKRTSIENPFNSPGMMEIPLDVDDSDEDGEDGYDDDRFRAELIRFQAKQLGRYDMRSAKLTAH